MTAAIAARASLRRRLQIEQDSLDTRLELLRAARRAFVRTAEAADCVRSDRTVPIMEAQTLVDRCILTTPFLSALRQRIQAVGLPPTA